MNDRSKEMRALLERARETLEWLLDRIHTEPDEETVAAEDLVSEIRDELTRPT